MLVVALELELAASLLCAAFLVRVVTAIIFPVTLPLLRNAELVLAAGKLLRSATVLLSAGSIGERHSAVRTLADALPVAAVFGLHAIGTEALQLVLRHADAEVRTGVISGALVGAGAVDVAEDLEVHGAVHVASDGFHLLAAVLVRGVDGLLVPVVPVHQLLVDGHGERVDQLRSATEYSLEVVTVQIAGGNVILASVYPVHSVGNVVDGESIGPTDVGFRNQGLGLQKNEKNNRVLTCLLL